MTGAGNVTTAPYGRREQRADRRKGRRDGRKHQPAYGRLAELVDRGEPVGGSYLAELAAQRDAAVSQAYQAFLRRTANDSRLLRASAGLLASATKRIEWAEHAIVTATESVTEQDLAPRNPIELRLRPDVIRGRREEERHRRIATARGQHAGAVAAADELDQSIDAARARIGEELTTTRNRARTIDEFYLLRATRYWEGVARTHPDGRQLALLVPRLLPALPDWVEAGPADRADGVPGGGP